MITKIFAPTLLLIGLALILAACSSILDSGSTESVSSANHENVSQAQSPAGSSNQVDPAQAVAGVSYTIVDTGQNLCYGESGQITCPQPGQSFYGQDAQYTNQQPSFVDNGDGTVSDLNTGLMWAQDPGAKVSFEEAVAGAGQYNLAGYDDWRLPTIKELYSLIDFNGRVFRTESESTPFIDTNFFVFEYGDESAGARLIDAQYFSSTEYVGLTMNGNSTVFGVNFADGRIKGYPKQMGRTGGAMTQFVRYVRGNTSYGINDFVDNGDGTISDRATGLMWMQDDSGSTYDWDGALNYCENLNASGYDDWRLPNAKELHSIVDYTRAPDAANPSQQAAAIDPIFNITSDDSFFWTGTTHMDGPNFFGVYFAFGEAWGEMEIPPNSGNRTLMNVHGAGAQRSDPKAGDPGDFYNPNAPQGDIQRIYNYARCVRGSSSIASNVGSAVGANAQVGAAEQQGVPQINLVSAAAELGVTEDELQAALGDPSQGRPDLMVATEILGVTPEALIAALGLPEGGPPPGGVPSGG